MIHVSRLLHLLSLVVVLNVHCQCTLLSCSRCHRLLSIVDPTMHGRMAQMKDAVSIFWSLHGISSGHLSMLCLLGRWVVLVEQTAWLLEVSALMKHHYFNDAWLHYRCRAHGSDSAVFVWSSKYVAWFSIHHCCVFWVSEWCLVFTGNANGLAAQGVIA